METLEEKFNKFEDEYLEFEKIEKPLHPSRDICGLLYIHNLIPFDGVAVGYAEHDIVGINVSCDKLNNIIKDEDIIYLKRCGISYDSEYDSLIMMR